MARLAVALVICLLIAGCGGSSSLTSSSIPIETLRSAPEQIQVGGHLYKIGPQTSLYRNLMPGYSESGGGSLTATVSITDVYAKPAPLLKPDHLWVINGDQVWEAAITADTPVASGGPKWNTGTQVDVVVRVLDMGGTAHLLRASGVVVGVE